MIAYSNSFLLKPDTGMHLFHITVFEIDHTDLSKAAPAATDIRHSPRKLSRS